MAKPGDPLVLKAQPAALPERPGTVPAPDRIKVAIIVPSANPQPEQADMTIELLVPFVLKFEWEGFFLEFRQDGGVVRPVFRGPRVLDMGGFPRPDGWSNVQATAANRWATACWKHLRDITSASASQWLAMYGQAAGVQVWNVIEALVEAEEVPAA